MLKIIFSSLAVAICGFSVFSLPLESQARTCELKQEGESLSFLFKADGSPARPPTMREVFDGMNAEGSNLFEDLKFDEEKQSQALVFLQNDSDSPRYSINWARKPKATAGDPACVDKKLTGYECRVKQLKMRKTAELGTLPGGIQTSVVIQVPSTNKALVQRIGNGLGCERLLFANGQSFDTPADTSSAAPKKGKPLVLPAGAGSTAP